MQTIHVRRNDSDIFPKSKNHSEFSKCYAKNCIRHPVLVCAIFRNVPVFHLLSEFFVIDVFRRLYNMRSRVKFDATQSLHSLIEQFQDIVNKRELISTENINILVDRINAANCSKADAAELLRICNQYRYDPRQRTIISQIWQIFSKRKGFLQYEHFNTMLSFYSKAGLTKETQEMFDELMKMGFTPSP